MAGVNKYNITNLMIEYMVHLIVFTFGVGGTQVFTEVAEPEVLDAPPVTHGCQANLSINFGTALRVKNSTIEIL